MKLTCSIPIPANTRGVPVSSYGPSSPTATATFSTSPRNTFAGGAAAFSTSPGSHSRPRSLTANINQMARQLTAFLPSNYSLAEEDEGVATPKRQGKQRILLLENINLDAADFLKKSGFEVRRAGLLRSRALTAGRPRHQGVL